MKDYLWKIKKEYKDFIDNSKEKTIAELEVEIPKKFNLTKQDTSEVLHSWLCMKIHKEIHNDYSWKLVEKNGFVYFLRSN